MAAPRAIGGGWGRLPPLKPPEEALATGLGLLSLGWLMRGLAMLTGREGAPELPLLTLGAELPPKGRLTVPIALLPPDLAGAEPPLLTILVEGEEPAGRWATLGPKPPSGRSTRPWVALWGLATVGVLTRGAVGVLTRGAAGLLGLEGLLPACCKTEEGTLILGAGTRLSLGAVVEPPRAMLGSMTWPLGGRPAAPPPESGGGGAPGEPQWPPEPPGGGPSWWAGGGGGGMWPGRQPPGGGGGG